MVLIMVLMVVKKSYFPPKHRRFANVPTAFSTGHISRLLASLAAKEFAACRNLVTQRLLGRTGRVKHRKPLSKH
jgi:hypothetical protein